MSEIIGPFHSLSESDRRGLVALVGSGRSVRSAAGELGCHYGHALNFCHAFGLPVVYKAKRVDRRGSQAVQLVELVRRSVMLLCCVKLGPGPRKVDTSGVSYAAWVSVAELSASKSSGARRLHQECRLRVL